jgi:predicted metal-dependent phosphoesterase TrpH
MYTAFKSAGGDAIEVVCAGISPQTLHQLASDARTYQFHGSCGSDFHSPENTWIRLGRLAEFPIGVRKVWDLF